MAFTPNREQIDAVADWRLRKSENRAEQPIFPLLRERFKLTALEAVSVIRASKPGGAHDRAS
jgi:hypothetical protein